MNNGIPVTLNVAHKLPVNELFRTVQGEGYWTGSGATFVRLQGCPVACPWCDTKHTWSCDAEHRIEVAAFDAKAAEASEAFAMLTVDELVERIADKGEAHVVITGGEPCLYDLAPLCTALAVRDHVVQVETSGTALVRVGEHTWVTVSPKVGMPGGFGVRMDALNRANEVKFPVASSRDVERLTKLAEASPWHDGAHLYVQPVSSRPHAIALSLEVVHRLGWRLSVQTHALLGLR